MSCRWWISGLTGRRDRQQESHCSRLRVCEEITDRQPLTVAPRLNLIAIGCITIYMTQRELKKGSAELLILSLVEQRARHGYEISKLIAARSEGTLTFQLASLYPLLYRLEGRGWIQGRWVEKAGERRRRFYRLTPAGRKVLAAQRQGWLQFAEAIRRITGIEYA